MSTPLTLHLHTVLPAPGKTCAVTIHSVLATSRSVVLPMDEAEALVEAFEGEGDQRGIEFARIIAPDKSFTSYRVNGIWQLDVQATPSRS